MANGMVHMTFVLLCIASTTRVFTGARFMPSSAQGDTLCANFMKDIAHCQADADAEFPQDIATEELRMREYVRLAKKCINESTEVRTESAQQFCDDPTWVPASLTCGSFALYQTAKPEYKPDALAYHFKFLACYIEALMDYMLQKSTARADSNIDDSEED